MCPKTCDYASSQGIRKAVEEEILLLQEMCNKKGPEPLHSDFLQDIGLAEGTSGAEDIGQQQDLLFIGCVTLTSLPLLFLGELIGFFFGFALLFVFEKGFFSM